MTDQIEPAVPETAVRGQSAWWADFVFQVEALRRGGMTEAEVHRLVTEGYSGHTAAAMAGGQREGRLQDDLLTLIARLEQIDSEDEPGGYLWQRVMTSDIPRLRSYLTGLLLPPFPG